MVYQRSNITRLADFLFPGICYLCHGPVTGGAILCAGCNADLPQARPIATAGAEPPFKAGAIDVTITPFRYDYPINVLIQDLKYGHKVFLAKALGHELSRHLEKVCTSLPDCLLPVPLHPHRHLARGFNQAQEISRVVAGQLSLPVDQRLLRRIKNTRSQVELDPGQRSRNVRGAFALTATPAYQFVAIIDDVITTGATVNELARQLKRAGVKRVEAWACARTEPERSGPG